VCVSVFVCNFKVQLFEGSVLKSKTLILCVRKSVCVCVCACVCMCVYVCVCVCA